VGTHHLIVGGAGFIGSHVVARLLSDPADEVRVRVFDNLASGSRERLARHEDDPRFELVVADIKDLDVLLEAAEGIDRIFHFAANPDIAAAVERPDIDFWEGTYLANNVLEAARRQSVTRLTYASGSGVYGDIGTVNASEDHGPMHPISTYGASKLGCEALISAYCHMFGMHASVFRFANVVGPRQTHGVTYDFVRKLRADPSRLAILGDGSQSKSYIHVEDVVDAMLLVAGQERSGFEVFNVGTDEYITVTEIADLVVQTMREPDVTYAFTGGDRGWKGDVPVVRFSSERIRERGWRNQFSTRDALLDSIRSNVEEAAHDA
jgi:UDP-glucose 4-epimerase